MQRSKLVRLGPVLTQIFLGPLKGPWIFAISFKSIIQNTFSAAFDILNKSGDTLTVKELSLLFGKEETADALVMENFLRKIIKDHNDQAEVSFDEFKMLVSKNEEFRGIQTAFEVMS